MAATGLAINERYYDFIREHPEICKRDIGIISKSMPNATRILDIGCGGGSFVSMCIEQLGGAIGIDPSGASTRICRSQGLPAILAEGSTLPFISGSLDVVRAKEIIEHILDLRPFMQEVYRVLRPGGLFLSQTPTQYSILYPVTNFYDDYTHIRPLSKPGIRRLLTDASFETLSIRGYTAGRNAAERLLGRALAQVFPLSWVALARKP